MALNYIELVEKLVNTPLTEEELRLVDEAEAYIDNIILEKFDLDCEIRIPSRFPLFKCSPSKDYNNFGLKEGRRIELQLELEKRYSKAGWVISNNYQDSMSDDYWILTGKRLK